MGAFTKLFGNTILENLAVGTTASTVKLLIRGSGSTSATTSLLVQNSASTELFRLTDEGYLGMKVANPLAPLHIFYPGTNPNTKTIAIFDGYVSPTQPVMQIQIGTTSNNYGSLFGHEPSVGGFVRNLSSATYAITWGSTQNLGFGGNPVGNNAVTIYSRNFSGVNEINTTGAMLRIATGSIQIVPQTATPDTSMVGLGAITLNSVVIPKTYTNASNLYIESPPIAGNSTTITNRWSIFVNSGNSYFNGSILAGATSLNSSAIIQANSTTQGFLPPRMTTAQKNAIVSPAEGLMVYDTDLKRPCFHDGTNWITL